MSVKELLEKSKELQNRCDSEDIYSKEWESHNENYLDFIEIHAETKDEIIRTLYEALDKTRWLEIEMRRETDEGHLIGASYADIALEKADELAKEVLK